MTRRRKARCQDVRGRAVGDGTVGLITAHPLRLFSPAGAGRGRTAPRAGGAGGRAWRDRVLLLGLAGNRVNAGFPIDDVVNNDLVITASFGYTSGAWAEVTGLLSSGQLRLAPLITHRFPLQAYADADATLRHGTRPRGKVLIEVNAP
jgi:hypothetical protein